MFTMKVGVAALNQTPLDWDGNLRNIRAAIAEARRQEVAILCLPELCISGYGCEDAFHSPSVLETAFKKLEALVLETQGMVVSVGLPVLFNNGIYNTACLMVDGQLLGFVAKQFLAGDGLHYEPRWFKAWPAGVRAILHRGASSYPIGDLLFDLNGVKLGFEICEDAWVATRPGAEHARAGVDLILNPSASHFAFDKVDVRERFVLEGSRAFGIAYLYTNLLGNEAGRALYDGCSMIASGGRLLATGPRFSFTDMVLTTALVDIELNRMGQARSASFRPNIASGQERVVFHAHHIPCHPHGESVPVVAAWERSPERKKEEFTRAIALGLFDYLRKSRSRGFVVSLSGGADSAAVSCQVAHLVQLGVQELGTEGFCNKLPYLPALKSCRDNAARVRCLLTTAYQGTRNSSDVTRTAARTVAEALGAEFFELELDSLVSTYIGLIEQALGRALTWEQDDIALQNIQARVRSPSVWLLANLKGALLLSTSNRSEAAVGYATMDGDTSGGLSPIAGIDKAFLREWLVWLEKVGPEGLGPLPALKVINAQQPTAELRPLERAQTDEADLMPYPVLDFVERCAIRDKRSPLECYQLARTQFPQHEPRQLLLWVERFFRLWCRNQWKRERYAPSFHVDDESLDPKTWCRFPILSGGFEEELRALRAWVETHEF